MISKYFNRSLLTLIVVGLSSSLIVSTAHAGTIKYWNVFNREGESAQSNVLWTYNTLIDMLGDTNRQVEYQNHRDLVDSNAFQIGSELNPIPEPSTMLLLGTGIAGPAVWRWK